ncbi:FAD-dependent oxidoreductase [Cyclobacterium marinum]|uniref:FAD-dependent oxidoreductase n=1 Tax=Cyclobacterium marinum TaxID=104 RepID=UPI0011F01982|nr:FAD-dependent oxidoreductase [Cyclobacterium marinum]MBI0400935.1 FAD-dependent oxidoreductase [Cyclobacterium marinum]
MNEITLYGADWCPDCLRAKAFLKENNIAFNFVDVDLDEAATRKVEAINKGKRIIPTLIINGKSYTNPDNATLSSVLGINEQARVILFGADWCPDCIKSKTYLVENKVNFQYINIDENEWAIPIIEKINNGKRKIPTILINDDILVEPENEALRIALKLDEEKITKVFDSIIIGAGAAGLTTSIYAQRDRFSTLILEKKTVGGNAFLTDKIENYPGFTSISGPNLMAKMEEQARVYGAIIKTGEEVVSIEKADNLFNVRTKTNLYLGRSIVLSTGSTYEKLNIPGESELLGSSVHFCATCDGAFYRDKEVIVVGGGNSALEEGIFLSGFTKKVKIVNRKASFKASQTYIDKLPELDNITAFYNKESIALNTDKEGKFAGLLVKDTLTGKEEVITADGVFVFVGLKPNNGSFKGLVDMNEQGFITTSGLAKTSVEGIFAAGDNREGAIAQVAAATGEGVLASYGLRAFLKG